MFHTLRTITIIRKPLNTVVEKAAGEWKISLQYVADACYNDTETKILLMSSVFYQQEIVPNDL